MYLQPINIRLIARSCIYIKAAFSSLCIAAILYVYSSYASFAKFLSVKLPLQGSAKLASYIALAIFLIITYLVCSQNTQKSVSFSKFTKPQFFLILFLIARAFVFSKSIADIVLNVITLAITLSICFISNIARNLPYRVYLDLKRNVLYIFCFISFATILLSTIVINQDLISWKGRYLFYFAHPNQAAIAIGSLICFTLPLLIDQFKKRKTKSNELPTLLLLCIVVFGCFVFLLMTGSRTGLSCTFISLMIGISFISRSPLLAILVGVILIIIFSLLDIQQFFLQEGNVRSFDFSNTSGRLEIWGDFIASFAVDPLFGALSRTNRSESAYLLALGGGGLFLFVPFILFLFHLYIKPFFTSIQARTSKLDDRFLKYAHLYFFPPFVLIVSISQGNYLVDRFTLNSCFILLSLF